MINMFSIVLLVMAIGITVVVMTYAILNGYLPDCRWEEWPNKHGPWHGSLFNFDPGLNILASALQAAVLVQLGGLISAIAAFCLRPSRISLYTICISLGSLFIYSSYLNWLID